VADVLGILHEKVEGRNQEKMLLGEILVRLREDKMQIEKE